MCVLVVLVVVVLDEKIVYMTQRYDRPLFTLKKEVSVYVVSQKPSPKGLFALSFVSLPAGINNRQRTQPTNRPNTNHFKARFTPGPTNPSK